MIRLLELHRPVLANHHHDSAGQGSVLGDLQRLLPGVYNNALAEVVHEALDGLGQADERDRSNDDRDEGDTGLGRGAE
jgi:hypothetical protein